MIDRDTIDRIFDTADIVEVISDFVSLKRSGQNYKGLSPFTNEKTPSFFVSPAKGIYKDFSSGKGGNVVGFLMEHERLTYPEALRYLARKYNIEIVEQEPTPEEIQQRNERESLLIITGWAQKYFTNILQNTPEGQSVGMAYFRERGFHDDIIRKFQLGYSPEQKDALTNEALKKGYRLDYLVKTGLTIQKEEYKADRFRGRIIFPIHGLTGNVIGFGGRILRSDDKLAKYLNSPESDIYQKSRVLYGLYHAKQAIVKQEKCFLVEGYTDVLGLHQAGIENVVASSGTSLTTEQIRLIKRFTSHVTIIYDGDEAGIKASLRGIDMVLEEGLNIKVVPLPEGEDPDSYSKRLSATEFQQYIKENEKDFISFKTRLLMKDMEQDPVEKAGLINDVIRSISVIPDTVMRSVYIKESARMLDTEERILYSQVYRLRKKKAEDRYNKESRQEEIRIQSTPLPSFIKEIYSESQEKLLVRFLLQYGNERLYEIQDEHAGNEYISVAEYVVNEILNDELEFKNLLYRQIFEEVNNMIQKGEVIEIKHFVHHENPSISQLAVDLLSSPYSLSKVHSRKGAMVETEDMLLKKNVPKALIEYKRKILEVAQREKEEQIREVQHNSDDLEAVNPLMQQYITIASLINTISKERGWVILK
ncbi:MAG: DNA primase [Bacteroides sp. SM23_62]|nr:MAG: DNA primase [Bacteroides sp. SM23_62]